MASLGLGELGLGIVEVHAWVDASFADAVVQHFVLIISMKVGLFLWREIPLSLLIEYVNNITIDLSKIPR